MPHGHHDFDWSYQGFKENRPMRIGIGGPVGSGKTHLVKALAGALRDNYQVGVITNDIFTREDEAIIKRSGVLPEHHVIGVETGGCPHTAVREDISMNMDAVEELERRIEDLDLIFIESGGDNLAAAFSPELVDVFLYIIDVAQGDDIPRKGGPGITQSDLLVINKIDLAPYVRVDLAGMDRDAKKQRGNKPTVFTNVLEEEGIPKIVKWLEGEYVGRKESLNK